MYYDAKPIDGTYNTTWSCTCKGCNWVTEHQVTGTAFAKNTDELVARVSNIHNTFFPECPMCGRVDNED